MADQAAINIVVPTNQNIADPKITIGSSIQSDPNPCIAPVAAIRAMPGSFRKPRKLVYGQTAGRHSNGVLSIITIQVTADAHPRKISPYLNVRDCADMTMLNLALTLPGARKNRQTTRLAQVRLRGLSAGTGVGSVAPELHGRLVSPNRR